jgi:hypothetical protein
MIEDELDAMMNGGRLRDKPKEKKQGRRMLRTRVGRLLGWSLRKTRTDVSKMQARERTKGSNYL